MGITSSCFRGRGEERPAESFPHPSPQNIASASFSAARADMQEELERVFHQYDGDRDGMISAEELRDVLTSLGHPLTTEELCAMVAVADGDGDGFIDLREFVACCRGAAEVELRQAFEFYDDDVDGSISAEELQRVLRRLGEEASLPECRKIVHGAGFGGLMSFEDFKVMMMGSSRWRRPH